MINKNRLQWMRLILLGFLIFISLSCAVPKFSCGYTIDELIKNAPRIGLAKLIKYDTGMYGKKMSVLIIEQSLKGNCLGDTIIFNSLKEGHDGNHFNHHYDKKFWKKQRKGRSDWPCCICGPDFTFIKGENYLLFPDCFGAYKSAEIIANKKKDKWLKYVKAKLKE